MSNDPVKVLTLVQVVCDDCGFHTAPIADRYGGSESVAREWARRHRVTCPVKRDAPSTTEEGSDG